MLSDNRRSIIFDNLRKLVVKIFLSIDNLASQAKMYTKDLNVKTKLHKTIANIYFNKEQDRNINIIAGTTVENKGKLILTEIFPSVQKHDIF